MEEPSGFRKLIAWQKAFTLTREVYRSTEVFPRAEQYGLTSQLQRAALSIPSNIAEGYGRGQHSKDFARYLSIARGSLFEVETCLLLARDLRYLSEEDFQRLDQTRAEAARVLGGLIKSVGD